MKILMNCAFVLLAASGTCTAQTITGNTNTSISAEQFINQAAISGMKEVAISKMAKNNAQDAKIKSFGMMMVSDHSKVNDELKALAKSKSIKLPKPDTRNMPDATAGSGTMTNSGTTAGSGTDNRSAGAANAMGTTGDNKHTGNTNNHIGTIGAGNTGSVSSVNTGTEGRTATATTLAGNTGWNMQNGADSLKLLTEQDVSMAVQQLNGLKGAAFDSAYTQMMIDDHKTAITLFERGAQSSDSDIRAFATKHLPTLRSHLTQITSIKDGSGQP